MLPGRGPFDARATADTLVCALVTRDLALWSAAAPLVPHYRDELALSTLQVAWMLAAFSLAVVAVSVRSGTWPTGSAHGS